VSCYDKFWGTLSQYLVTTGISPGSATVVQVSGPKITDYIVVS